jgi:hypothetical protein
MKNPNLNQAFSYYLVNLPFRHSRAVTFYKEKGASFGEKMTATLYELVGSIFGNLEGG